MNPSAPLELLGISGSLRRRSSNTALLHAARAVAPADVTIKVYEGLGDLPLFNPDLEHAEPAPVTAFRAALRSADGLLIASPEYAHGVTGAMKNALDWVVGGEEFVNKPVALFNASPRAHHAYEALTEIVTVMSAHLVTEASITVPLLGRSIDAAGIAADPTLSSALREAIAVFAAEIRRVREQSDSID